jgi:hypothetical protein
VAALGSDLLLSTGQSVDVDTTVGTPVSAIKRQRDRTFIKEILEPDEPSLIVWQHEGRHRLPHLRSRRSSITLREAADQRIDGGLEMWA